MRKTIFATGEYYHIFNRGVEKRKIFIDDNDRLRFLTLLLIFQGKVHIDNIRRLTEDVQHLMLNKEPFTTILSAKTVELVCFCLMPNHYHLILKEITDRGISKYTQRLGDGFAKYFNTKYQRSGHLFGGTFQAKHISKNIYLKHLSAYIHYNPTELYTWNGKEDKYPWSSLQDYLGDNRWGEFLKSNIILNQFKNKKLYEIFAKESDVKKIKEDVLLD